MVVEGFDESDFLDVDNENIKDYDYFIRRKLNETPQFRIGLENNDYDIVHINFDITTDFMQNSAYLVQRVINWLRQHVDREEEIVVMGLSSGGIIARYALAEWEDTFTYHHDVRLYISFDAGHDGNNIPVGVQYMLDHFKIFVFQG